MLWLGETVPSRQRLYQPVRCTFQWHGQRSPSLGLRDSSDKSHVSFWQKPLDIQDPSSRELSDFLIAVCRVGTHLPRTLIVLFRLQTVRQEPLVVHCACSTY